MQLVAEGTGINIAMLGSFDGQFRPGESGQLRVYLRAPAPSSALSAIRAGMSAKGIASTVTQVSNTVFISFVQGGSPVQENIGAVGIAWVPVLAAIAILLLVLSILVIGWQLFKDVSSSLGILLPLLLVGGGLYLMSRVLKGHRRAT